MSTSETVLAAVDASRAASLEGLKDFLRIPSISTKPDHKPDMLRCAEWLAGQLGQCGMTATVLPTAGHPVVLAKNEYIAGRPTVLVYGHYDVQPPEPLDLWTTPAFEPTVRKNDAGYEAVFARGAVDDKGQVWCHVEALRAWAKAGGAPLNVTLLIEGEEEIGSPNLAAFIESHKAELKADVAVVSDTNQFARGVPAITYALRGLAYMEVKLTAADHDLHSGMYGGAVPNPANALCELLATLHDADGRINIPGMYDDVQELTPREREEFAKLPFDEAKYKASLNLTDVYGEKGFTTLERSWARPTCDINGLTSGYQGPGAKTVIASWASAKVSMRLVPNQDPDEIVEAFEKTLRDRCPRGCTIEFHRHGASEALIVPLTGKPMQLAAKALERGFGQPPAYMREGGSIPILGVIKRVLGLDSLLVGYGLAGDRAHAPDEHFETNQLYLGTRTAASLYSELAKL